MSLIYEGRNHEYFFAIVNSVFHQNKCNFNIPHHCNFSTSITHFCNGSFLNSVTFLEIAHRARGYHSAKYIPRYFEASFFPTEFTTWDSLQSYLFLITVPPDILEQFKSSLCTFSNLTFLIELYTKPLIFCRKKSVRWAIFKIS